MSINNRIVELAKNLGVSIAELARQTDVKQMTMSHVKNYDVKPGAEVLEKILNRYPNLNARWLITGVGEMWVKKSGYKQFEKESEVSEPEMVLKEETHEEKALRTLGGIFLELKSLGKRIDEIEKQFVVKYNTAKNNVNERNERNET